MKFFLFVLSFLFVPFQVMAQDLTADVFLHGSYDYSDNNLVFTVTAYDNMQHTPITLLTYNENFYNFYKNWENVTNQFNCEKFNIWSYFCNTSIAWTIVLRIDDFSVFYDPEGIYTFSNSLSSPSEFIFEIPWNNTQPTPQIEWCMDTLSITYNSQANIHVESMCQYPTPYTPQDITGYIDNSTVQSGATTWNITLNVNMTGATLNINKIQTWNQFTIINAVTNEKQITITLQQFDGQRLSVECTNYELTIPKNAINTEKGDTNANPITGNFTVAGCPTPTTPPDGEDTGSGTQAPVHKNTIKENNIYLSLYDTDEEWKIYLNMTNLVYLVGILSAFSIFFFVLFWFIKNSFLWKSKKSYR